MISSVCLRNRTTILCTRLVVRAQTSAATNSRVASARKGLTSAKQTNSGSTIPILGLGVYLIDSKNCGQACSWAIQHGYRHIDTASQYENEVQVGNALKTSGLPREDIFITTKLWTPDHGRQALDACKASLERLGLEYVDLYLIHGPNGGKIIETWDTLVELKKLGLAKSIGVSSFSVMHLKKLIEARPDNIPSVNQVEVHPYCTREELDAFCKSKGILLQAYSPLAKGQKFNDPRLIEMAKKYSKSPAQILIKWSLQRGYVCIPKSSKKERIVENADVFDFDISEDDMIAMNGWDCHLVTDWDVIEGPWLP